MNREAAALVNMIRKIKTLPSENLRNSANISRSTAKRVKTNGCRE